MPMEKEVVVLAPENLEKATYEALMENNEEFLNYLYDEMVNSEYMKNRIYKKRCKPINSIILEVSSN